MNREYDMLLYWSQAMFVLGLAILLLCVVTAAWWRYGETWLGALRKPRVTKDLPRGRIVEGPWTFQCCCPVCEYGRGYCESLLAAPEVYVPTVLTCPTCKTVFQGLTS